MSQIQEASRLGVGMSAEAAGPISKRELHLAGNQSVPGAAKQTAETSISGLLLLDKPAGITSFAAAARVRRLLRVDKVGHCGTLDPFATGLLLICINQATRAADQLLVQEKAYRCRLHLGVETDTLDHTGTVTRVWQGDPCGEDDLQEALAFFRGRHEQPVPRYSAVHVQGRRLHQLTRQGVDVPLPRREVEIHRLDLVEYAWPEAILEVHCSKGTYIRQLAADIGQRLHCGAHLNQLRRLASGGFHLDRAVSLEHLEAAKSPEGWSAEVIPLYAALEHLPAIAVNDQEVLECLRHGHLHAGWETAQRMRLDPNGIYPVRLASSDQTLLALWWPFSGAGERRLRVFSSN
jgi:tRNA pseudouridine55 synthase